MIAKINELKRTTTIPEVKSLCETTIAAMSSAIYNGVTTEARFEIERVATENLFEGLSQYPNDKLISEWLTNQKRLYSIKNIGVRKALNSLKENEAKLDPTLDSILETFKEKLDQYPEVLLYEEFISALSGEYNWVPGVNTQLDALKNRVDNYKNDIDITKILEVMKSSRSNYLLPLIEDVVNNYLSNKNEQTKHLLKETLVKFSYDPFIRDIINIVMVDATDLQLEYANSKCDIEKVYSPLMYLGENEVLFNMKGTFYIKKGNNVNKLKKEDIKKLDENFISLCEAINLPNVEIGRNDITVYMGKDVAKINADGVEVNGHKMNEEEFKGAYEVSQWTGTTSFYKLLETLRENFNEFAPVDFAKRLYLKENEGYSADIIKLRNNIFITTYDPINNKATFYRNINPIQAEKVINEHLHFDISKTFADILPNKEKILTSINETKQEYIQYIETLKQKIDQFRNSNSNVTAEVLEALEEELRDVKSEYKDYVNEMESYTNVSEATTVTIDVDGERYTVPIPEPTSTARGEESDNQTGTVVGAEHMEDSPASEVTFDDDETELLGDSPSIQDDKVDLGVDNVEAAADAAEAGEEEEGEEGEDETGDEGDIDIASEDEPEEGAEDEEGEDLDLGLDDEEPTEDEEEEEDKKEEGEVVEEPYSEKKDISEEGEDDAPEELEQSDLETEPAPEETELEPEPIETEEEGEETEGDVEVEDVEVEEKPKNSPKVFLVKKRVSENVNEDHKPTKKGQVEFIKKNKKDCKHTKEELMAMPADKIKKMYDALEKKMGIKETAGKKKLDESIQIGDTVKYKNEKGYVIGETQGDIIVQIQGSTYKVSPTALTLLTEKPEELVKPPYKFDDLTLQNLTIKALFEQYVKCGIYMRNTPVKIKDTFVKLNEWSEASEDKLINVLIEGRITKFPKEQIRILEDISVVTDTEPYAWAIYTNNEGELEHVLVNGDEFMEAYNDAGGVTIIRGFPDNPVAETVAKDRIQPNSSEETPLDMERFR